MEKPQSKEVLQSVGIFSHHFHRSGVLDPVDLLPNLINAFELPVDPAVRGGQTGGNHAKI